MSCGDWKLDSVDTNEETLFVDEIVNHPSYNPTTTENDIALVKVFGSFNCRPQKIWPACLPSTNVSTNRISAVVFAFFSFVEITKNIAFI